MLYYTTRARTRFSFSDCSDMEGRQQYLLQRRRSSVSTIYTVVIHCWLLLLCRITTKNSSLELYVTHAFQWGHLHHTITTQQQKSCRIIPYDYGRRIDHTTSIRSTSLSLFRDANSIALNPKRKRPKVMSQQQQPYRYPIGTATTTRRRTDRKSTRLNSSHSIASRMPSSA